MIVVAHLENSSFTISEEKSFKRIIETPLGSRVIRPKFGSLLHELIDKNMDDEFRMLLSSYLLDCFYDENHKAWDERLKPNSVELISLDSTNGFVGVRINFGNDVVELNLGGFNG